MGWLGHAKKRYRKRRFDAVDRRLHQSGWYDLSVRSDLDAVFIGGCGRSGTSLFKEVLNRHPRLACGPETSLFGLPFNIRNISEMWGISAAELQQSKLASQNLVRFAESFATRFLEEEGKERWVEKTPNNVRAVGKLLTWFPNARFIHVIRDGRDVVCSLRHHPKRRIINGKVVPVQSNNPVHRSATRWLNDTAAGLAFEGHPRVMAVRYEQLVADPASEFARVCAFIGESFDHEMLDADRSSAESRPGLNLNNPDAAAPVNTRSLGRWQRDLSADERRVFVDIAGELLIRLGYAPDHSWVSQ